MRKIDIGFKNELERYFNFPIVVEGKKDKASLESLGFKRVYVLNMNLVSLGERVEQIGEEIRNNIGERKVCILTDFDKEGKELFSKLRMLFQEQGIGIDLRLRSLLFRAGISHVEGLASFVDKLNV